MGQFLHKYNTDNVHTRAVIVGLINLLNSRVQYENVLSDTVIETIGVPFLPNMGGDERFLQDFFTHWNDCKHPRMADGNYDVIPRGVVTLKGNSIDTSAMTHRFVRGSYVKEINGELQRFNAFLNSLPLSMEFDIEVMTDTVLDAFKIQQAILETFYKVQVFSVNFKGFRVPCQAGFSEDLGIEKTFEFSYQSENIIKFVFSISVETYYPVTDPTTERLDSNRMIQINSQPSEGGKLVLGQRSLNSASNGIGLRVYPAREKEYPPYYIEFTSPVAEDTFFSSGTLPLTWVNTGSVPIVNLYYKIENTDEWIPIVTNVKNTGFFEWVIPYFNESGQQIESDDVVANAVSDSGYDSRLRAIIGIDGSVEHIVIFEPGLAYNGTDQIEVAITPKPFVSTPLTVNPVISANVDGSGGIIGTEIVDAGSGFIPSPITRIFIKIEDSFNPNVYGILSKSGIFHGDIDSTTIIEDRYYISNINPTAFELINQGYIKVGSGVEGSGIPDNTIIDEIDIINNRLKLNNQVTLKNTNVKFQLSHIDAILTIK